MLSTVFYSKEADTRNYFPTVRFFIGICWKWTPTTDLQEKRLM